MPRMNPCRTRSKLTFLGMMCFFTIATSCSEDEDKKTQRDGAEADVSVSLVNSTQFALGGIAPDYFGERLEFIYLKGTTEVNGGSNRDVEVVIWASEHCTPDDQQITAPPSPDDPEDVEEVLFSFKGLDHCSGNDDDYFDFARSTASVNADLNSQNMPVPPGTYTEVVGKFKLNDAGRNQWRYQAGQMTEAVVASGSSSQTTGSTIGTFGESLVIAEGETVVVSVSYDLSNVISEATFSSSTTAADGCTDVSANSLTYRYCVNGLEITPSAEKQTN